MSDHKTVERTSVVARVMAAASQPQSDRKTVILKDEKPTNWWHCHPANANANHSKCKVEYDQWPDPVKCPCDCHKN